MAAVISSPAPAVAPRPAPPLGSPAHRGRPALRVIEGGRSPAAVAATFRRRRVVAAVLLVAVLGLAMAAGQAALDAAAGWAAPRPAAIEGPTVDVQARSGDTLWSLARRVHPSGDVRPAVEAMLAERGTAAVQVGEVVRVPAP